MKHTQDIKAKPSELFNYLKDSLSRRFKTSFYQYLDLSVTGVFLFLADTQTFSRTIEGDFIPLFRDNFKQSHTIVPGGVTSSSKVYRTTKTQLRFKSIEKEFEMNEEVLVCHPDKRICGAKGRVVGYASNGRGVKVRVEQEPKYNDQRMSDIIKLLSTKADIFFSLRFAAELVGTKFDHLSTILGGINIVMPKDSKLPPSIDIGLNFMSRREHKIVPNLVRVNFHYDK